MKIFRYAEERKAREDLGKGETKIQDTSTSIPTELKGAVPGTTLPEHEVSQLIHTCYGIKVFYSKMTVNCFLLAREYLAA